MISASVERELTHRLDQQPGFELAILTRVSIERRLVVLCGRASRAVEDVSPGLGHFDACIDRVTKIEAAVESLWSTWLAL